MSNGTGQILQPAMPPEAGQPRLRLGGMDPAQAAAVTLAAYLRAATFTVWDDAGIGRQFRLEEVYEEWPDPAQPLPYPCASITRPAGSGTIEGSGLTPQALEDTWDEGSETVLWKLGEQVLDFQVDFWCNTAADREAIAARLPGLFAPGESAASVLLQGPPQYFCLPVRVRLQGYERVDEPGQVYSHERRLRARVRCEVDVVEARCATMLTAGVELAEVGSELQIEED